MASNEPPATIPIRLGRRSVPERIRFCAEKLRAQPGSEIVALAVAMALELTADEIESGNSDGR